MSRNRALAVLALLTTASTDDSGPRAQRLIALFIDGLGTTPPKKGEGKG
jgi:hypothetical protein